MRILLGILIFSLNAVAYAQSWREIKGDHFIVFSPAVSEAANSTVAPVESIDPEEFCKEILRKAEIYYERIADDLGYQRSSEFWTWDKRVKIYIYSDHEAFVKSANNPEWAGGAADYDTKSITSYLGSKDFTDTILPHEIAHLVFRDFVGFKGEVPLWLDEGVAQWTEEKKRQEVKKAVKELLTHNGLLTMEDMMKLQVNQIKNPENVYIRPTRTRDGDKGVLFLTGNNLVATYYIEAVSLVGFLIEKFGKNEFTNFCRSLRDGNNWEEALTTVYSTHIHNLNDFDDQWKEYIENDT
jgi:hypothetical protein